jgi:hypothetical protein
MKKVSGKIKGYLGNLEYIECGKLKSGKMINGQLKELGLPEEKEEMIDIDGKKFPKATIRQALKEYYVR